MNTSQTKRVLVFSLAYLPELVGGAEIAVKEITDRIPNIEFSLITIRGPHSLHIEKVGAVMVYRVGPRVNTKTVGGRIVFQLSKYLYPLLAYNRARILHNRNKFDTVWSIMANHAGFAAMFFKKKFPGVRFVLTLQEGDPIDSIKRKVWLVYPWFKQIFLKADYIQAISKYLLTFAHDMGYKGEASVVGNGVDIESFGKIIAEDAKASIRSKLGFEESDTILVTASRLVKKNGIEYVIRSLPELSGIKFLVIGTGALESHLKNLAHELNVENRVVFVGFVPHAELPVYLQVSTIFIRPSLSEGLGNSFLEAMTACIPVIATPVGGIPDFLIDGVTGIYCEPKNPLSIMEAVSRLLEGDLSKTIVSNAFEMVKEKYDWNIVAQEMKKVL